MDNPLFLVFGFGAPIAAAIFALVLAKGINRRDAGTERMQQIAALIRAGAMAFLKTEYSVLAVFVGVMFVILVVFLPGDALLVGVSFLVGAALSGLAGWIGMRTATGAAVRTTAAARTSLAAALQVAFSSGAVMGLTVVALGTLGVAILYYLYGGMSGNGPAAIGSLFGLSLGASSIALFARVGGGIFTKAADVAGDLSGKVEAGIPEDDPRNPATIADSVGDNVGDVAGMGADLFESYVGSIIATLALAATGGALLAEKGLIDLNVDLGDVTANFDHELFMLPILVAAVGIISSIIGTFLVRAPEGAEMGRLLWALRIGIFSSGILVLIAVGILIPVLDLPFELFWVILTGLVAGQIIGTASEVATSYEYSFTRNIAAQSETGPATVIIGGLGLGMLSTLVPGIVVVAAMWLTNDLAGTYGIALAAVGMLSTLGITLATDAYGPVADNAGGIAEQAHLGPEVRDRTDALDSLGNTTAATGKGFAIGSAVLTALALMAAYVEAANIDVALLALTEVKVIMGLLIGSMMPFLFAALTMQAVGRAAGAMVQEVRRQFREIPGIMDGTGEPDYEKTVDISTNGAMREMVVPGLMAIITPVAVGMILGAAALGGLLIGSIATGFLLAIMMANAGGAWDNAKKYVEAGAHGGKGTPQHAAVVVGDTVGDPFKDTSGPALNILIKLMSIVALVFAPLFL